MVQIDTVYEGQLRCTATHGPSGLQIHTDAPKDNEGRGESYSPTDLVATALATCAMTIIGIVARRDDIDVTGMKATVEKHMVADPHRRIARLPVAITMPSQLSAEQREKLENAAELCPVKQSIRADIDAPFTFDYV